MYFSLQLTANVRRYVQLAQSRGGACFCTRGAIQGYDGYYLILALAKTVTPGGSPRRELGRPAPPLKIFHFDQKVLAAQKPIAYTDLLAVGFYCSITSTLFILKPYIPQYPVYPPTKIIVVGCWQFGQ